ncbi:MAG: hypothetical protein AB7Q00_14550 [Phycisphaerales bacterium]
MKDIPPLTIVCWKWGAPGYRINFTAHHVNVLASMVKRNYKRPHRFVCITDDPTGIECETFPLWKDCGEMINACGTHLPSCYRRLRIFNESVAKQFGERILSIDLDVVITGDITPVWEQPHDFVGWAVPGVVHARVYNGSMFMFRAGAHTDLWDEFDPQVSPDLSNKSGYFGSDQAWISYKLKGQAPGWNRSNGVVSYPREQRKMPLSPTTRIVIFHGKRKPWDPAVQNESPWVLEHWR